MVDWLSSAEIADHRPAYSLREVERLVLEAYGLESHAAPLPSDRDRNFRVSAAGGRDYVLRIVSAVTPPERIAFEVEVLSRLEGRLGDVTVPAIVPTVRGETIFATEDGHAAYMVRWVGGKPYAEVRPHTRELLSDLGRTAAMIDAVLCEVEEHVPLAASPWNLLEAGEVVAEGIDHVADPDRRSLLERFARRFRDAVEPVMDRLPRQVIHNDLNDHNVLVAVESSGLKMAGVLDVGDAHYSVRVADPVIAAAYAALHWEDPVAAAAVVAGQYDAILPLTEDELAAFLAMLAMRLCASVCISARRATEESSDPYVMISQQAAWATLERLNRSSFDLGHYRIRAACGREPCPASAQIREWMAARTDSFAAISSRDLRAEDVLPLDLSVASPARYVLASEPEATREIHRAMETAGADVAIGRYDEVRLAYSNALFEVQGLEGSVQRTVHLGADVFLAAGQEVRAPLAGVVFAMADNQEELSYGPTIILRHEPEDGPPFFTLFGHLCRSDLSALQVGQAVDAGQVIGHIGAASENKGWTPHVHFQVIADMLDRRSDFPGVCAYSERATWTSISPNPYPMLGLDIPPARSTECSPDDLAARRLRVLGTSLSVSYDLPLLILRARDTYMYDHEGRRYLDCVNNVNHVGHCHPRVASAVSEQMAVLNTNTRYLHPTILAYAERLTATLPRPLEVCFFVNSGSEANDLALRLARAHTGGEGIVVVDAAYHGHLTSLIEISPYKFKGPGGRGPGKATFVAPLPDVYRGEFRGADAASRYASTVKECLEVAELESIRLAAFMSESLLSCGGQIELPPGYLERVYDTVRACGSICIADEVQVGFGRVGTHFWGFQTQEVVPDIVTMGKPIGNGYPLGAVVTTAEVAASFDPGMEYFNTYGGNPVSCAAGLAVLETVEREGLQSHALEVGSYLKARLEELKAKTPLVGDVRGRGLFLGIELVTDPERRDPATRQAHYVINRARRLGVLLSTDGPDHNVIKIKPPLTFSRRDADRLVEVLASILVEDPLRI